MIKLLVVLLSIGFYSSFSLTAKQTGNDIYFLPNGKNTAKLIYGINGGNQITCVTEAFSNSINITNIRDCASGELLKLTRNGKPNETLKMLQKLNKVSDLLNAINLGKAYIGTDKGIANPRESNNPLLKFTKRGDANTYSFPDEPPDFLFSQATGEGNSESTGMDSIDFLGTTPSNSQSSGFDKEINFSNPEEFYQQLQENFSPQSTAPASERGTTGVSK